MWLITEKLDHFCLGEKQTKPNTDEAAFIMFPSDRERELGAEECFSWRLNTHPFHPSSSHFYLCAFKHWSNAERLTGSINSACSRRMTQNPNLCCWVSISLTQGWGAGEAAWISARVEEIFGWAEDLKSSTRNSVSKRPKDLWGCAWRCWSTCKQCRICTSRSCAAEIVFGEGRLTSSCHQPVLVLTYN